MVKFFLVTFFTEGAPHDAGADLSDTAREYADMIRPHCDGVFAYTPRAFAREFPDLAGAVADKTRDVLDHPQCSAGDPHLTAAVARWAKLGFFQWKPHLLLRFATSAPGVAEGDIVMYHGVDFRKYPQYARGVDGWRGTSAYLLDACRYDVYVTHDNGTRLKHDVKGALIARYLDASFADVEGVWGDLVIFRKSLQSRAFLARWAAMCDDPANLQPYPDAVPRHPSFIHHSADQSVLGVLVNVLKRDGALPRDWPPVVVMRRDLTVLWPRAS